MIAYYDQKPSKIEAVGNGSYLYRWNIKNAPKVIEQDKKKSITVPCWECEEALIWSPLTANRITEEVLTEKWGNNHEQKLVNEYNAAQLGVYPEEQSEKCIKAYKDFLTERDYLKKQIDADFAEYEKGTLKG